MHPPGRAKCAVDDQGRDDRDRSHDEDQEGRGAVPNVEATVIQTARGAAFGEADPPVEQRVCTAARTVSRKDSPAARGPVTGCRFIHHGSEADPRLAPSGSGGEETSPGVRRAPAAPHVDGGEEEQPYNIDKVPVPRRRLEPEMLPGREVTLVRANQADGEEDGADDHVEAVESRGHE